MTILIVEIMISTPEEVEEDSKDSEVEIMVNLITEIIPIFKEKVIMVESLIITIVIIMIEIIIITIIAKVEKVEEIETIITTI